MAICCTATFWLECLKFHFWPLGCYKHFYRNFPDYRQIYVYALLFPWQPPTDVCIIMHYYFPDNHKHNYVYALLLFPWQPPTYVCICITTSLATTNIYMLAIFCYISLLVWCFMWHNFIVCSVSVGNKTPHLTLFISVSLLWSTNYENKAKTVVSWFRECKFQ